MRNQLTSGPAAGLIRAFENDCCSPMTSTQLDGMHGLSLLSGATGYATYADAALANIKWTLKT